MRKPYENAEIPSWVNGADKETLINHIKYLTHVNSTLRKQLANARYRYNKAEKELKEVKVNGID